MAGRWFSPGTPVSSTNKTDRYDIPEIWLKVAFNINQNLEWIYMRQSNNINLSVSLNDMYLDLEGDNKRA